METDNRYSLWDYTVDEISSHLKERLDPGRVPAPQAPANCCDQQTSGAVDTQAAYDGAGLFGTPQVKGQIQRPQTVAESTMNRLSEMAYRATVNGDKARKVLDIVTRRPEIFEIIEALNSGLVY